MSGCTRGHGVERSALSVRAVVGTAPIDDHRIGVQRDQLREHVGLEHDARVHPSASGAGGGDLRGGLQTSH